MYKNVEILLYSRSSMTFYTIYDMAYV